MLATASPSTPVADGFHMPAEFEPHDGCYLIWPERTDTWRLGAKPAHIIGMVIGLDGVPDAIDLARKALGPPRIIIHPYE